MSQYRPLLTQRTRVAFVDTATENDHPEVRTRATRDHELIRRWAMRRSAEPATGEQTVSGDRTTKQVNDGDAGIRFNYPGFSPYRAISWDEWFDNFDRHHLTFVFEHDEPGQPLANRCRLVAAAEMQEYT